MAVSAEQLVDEEPIVATPHLRLVVDDEEVVEDTTPNAAVSIPLAGSSEAPNLTAAAAELRYEARRQRNG